MAASCSEFIALSKTGAELEAAIIECLREGAEDKVINNFLQAKAKELTNNKAQIALFLAKNPAQFMESEVRLSDGKRRDILANVTSPGVKPHIFYIGVIFRDNRPAEVLLEITDQPI